MKQLYLFLFFFLPFLSISQIEHFSKVYKDSDESSLLAKKVIGNYNGGAFVAGSRNTDSRAIVFNVDQEGEIIWSKNIKQQYDSSLVIYDMIQTFDSCLVIAGRFEEEKGLCIKLDTLGNEVWHRGFENPWGLDGATRVVETSDSCYAVFGASKASFASSYGDVEILKVDNTGAVMWEKAMTLSANKFHATSAIETSDGGFLISGNSDYVGDLNGTFIKFSSSGAFEWCRKINELSSIAGMTIIGDTLIAVGGDNGSVSILFMDETVNVHRAIKFLPDSVYTSALNSIGTDVTLLDGNRFAFSTNSWVDGSSTFALDQNGLVIENKGFIMRVTDQSQASDNDLFVLGTGDATQAPSQICLKRLEDTLSVNQVDICMVDHYHPMDTVSYTTSDFTNVSFDSILTPPLNIIISDYSGLEAFDQCVDTTSVWGISETQNIIKIEIFPNSSDGLFKIKGGVKIEQMKVWTSIGELIFNEQLVTNSFDLRGNKSGIYFFEGQTENGEIAHGKLMILN